MVDGETSPRQKMIGLMYLVLTAMLALQVSSSVLDKFVLLNNSIENNIRQQTQYNEEYIAYLKKSVQDVPKESKSKQELDQLLLLHKEAQQILGSISLLKNRLIKMGGGIDRKTKFPKGLMNHGHVENIMITKQEGKKLKDKLDTYVHRASNLAMKKYPLIAFDAKDHDLFRNNPNQSNKDFAILNFDHTPLGAALATLSQFASDVLNVEADLLKVIGHKINLSGLKFDTIKLVTNTQSNVVTAGTRYRADLILAASSSSVEPEMLVNGQPIQVENGVGKISFVATPGNYDKNGFATKYFQATAKIRKGNGDISTITQQVPYTVAQPVIKVKSAAIQSLYNNCGNNLEVQVPTLGLDYNPTFKVDNGSIITTNKRGVVIIVPKVPSRNGQIKLSVYNNGDFIGTEVFNVHPIPHPDVILTSNKRPLNISDGITIPGPRSLEIVIKPNEHFKNFLPDDARYKVEECQVSLVRKTTVINKITVTNDSVLNIRPLTASSRSGDRLIVEIKKLSRLNFRNESEIVHYKSPFVIPIN